MHERANDSRLDRFGCDAFLLIRVSDRGDGDRSLRVEWDSRCGYDPPPEFHEFVRCCVTLAQVRKSLGLQHFPHALRALAARLEREWTI